MPGGKKQGSPFWAPCFFAREGETVKGISKRTEFFILIVDK